MGSHRIAPPRMLYVVTLTYIVKVTNFKFEYLENGESWRKMLKYDFYRGWYLPRNGTIADAVLNDLNLNFQGQTLSCYALAIKSVQAANVSGSD